MNVIRLLFGLLYDHGLVTINFIYLIIFEPEVSSFESGKSPVTVDNTFLGFLNASSFEFGMQLIFRGFCGHAATLFEFLYFCH